MPISVRATPTGNITNCSVEKLASSLKYTAPPIMVTTMKKHCIDAHTNHSTGGSVKH